MRFVLSFLFCNSLFTAFSQNVTTVAGNGSTNYTGDGGPAINASFRFPNDVAFSPSGELYIADNLNSAIRKVDASGIITRFAGDGNVFAGYYGDGGKADTATLNDPSGLYFDAAGNLFFVDEGNAVVRAVNPGNFIFTSVGSGIIGYSGDGGPASAAWLNAPSDVMKDAAGNMYIADWSNHRIRKVNGGIITTIAGTGVRGYSGDGGAATAAEIDYPSSMAIDAGGNLLFTSGQRIRKIDPSGIISTVVGGGTNDPGDGDLAVNAAIGYPACLALNASGDLYFTIGNQVKKVNSSGVLLTVAGTLTPGFSGDGGPAYLAEFNDLMGLAFDATGTLFVADVYNQRIRKFIPSAQTGVVSQAVSDTVCEGVNTSFAIQVLNTTGLQWQVSQGGGWSNIANNSNYTGCNTTQLSIIAPPASMDGYQFRCIVFNTANDTSAAVTLKVKANHTLITASSPAFCTSSSIDTLTTSGATTYTWSTGSNNTTITVPAPSGTSVTFSVTGASNGCSTSASITLVKNIPSIQITMSSQGIAAYNGAAQICEYAWIKLTGTGLSTYHWLPGNDTTPVITKYPHATTQYTLEGFDANGCYEWGTADVFVDTTRSYLTLYDSTVCAGNAPNLYLNNTGGAWYADWYKNGVLIGGGCCPNNMEVTTAITTYSVHAWSWNGCQDTLVCNVHAIFGCVWPGDTNEDLVDDNTDLFPVGLEFGKAGPARSAPDQGNGWYGKECVNWNDTMFNGLNAKYADCDGNGVVGLPDTAAVSSNMNSTHVYRMANPAFHNDQNVGIRNVYVTFPKPVYYPGDTLLANVFIGSSTDPQTDFYGACFRLGYDKSKVVYYSEKFRFNNSWIGNINQQKIKISRIDHTAGFVDAAVVRITHTDTNGYGKIGTLSFIVKNTVHDTNLFFTISNAIKIDKNGVDSVLISGKDSVFIAPTCTLITSSDAVICLGSSVTLNASGADSYSWMPGSFSGPIQVVSPNGSTTYTITGSNQYGCVSQSTVQVTVNPLPNITFLLAIPDTVCLNSSAYAVNGGSPAGGSYGGPGLVSGFFHPNWVGAGTFDLTYSYTNANNCTNTAIDSITVVQCVGMAENIKKDQWVQVVPNPAHDKITVMSNITNDKLSFTNYLGELVLESPIHQEKTEIDLGDLPAGVYLLRIGEINYRLVKY